MTNDVAEYQGGAATVAPDWVSKLELVKSMVAKGCSQDEFELLCHLAKTYHLDPLAHEIWAIRYGQNPAQIFVGHAGLINLALRSGKLDGMKCEIVNPDGDDPVARATVWRNDMTHPIEAEVYWSEYGKDAKNPLWKSKPRTMLRKTAEVHALRRAFALSGLYTEEEMDHVPHEIPDTSRPVSAIAEPKAMTKKQPAEKCHTPGKTAPVDPTKCAQCGIPQEEAPGGWLVVADDGRRVCATCRNAGAQAELQVEKTPEIGAGFVCEECAKQLTNSEQKASKMLLSRALCKDCMQKWTAEEGIGA
jgi:phage recombination protein Bet